METRYLIDTNILIYFIEDKLPDPAYNFTSKIIANSFYTSVISKIEFLGWHRYKDADFQSAQSFIKHATVLELDELVANAAIVLKRQRAIKTPDAIIAATCLAHELTLVTRNAKDFEDIPKLKIKNPFDA